jgi:site-specific recombinase XerC
MAEETPALSGVTFMVVRAGGQIVDVQTNSTEIDHFLRILKLTRAHHTWVNYALDLKLFFRVVGVPPQAVGRSECLRFMEHQDREGRATATINRRLAAVSSLFQELNLLDPDRFPHNPVSPFQRPKRNGGDVPASIASKQCACQMCSPPTSSRPSLGQCAPGGTAP